MEILDIVLFVPLTGFYVNPKLYKLFGNALPMTEKETYTFDELIHLFHQYCSHRELLDMSNMKVSILKGDPMGKLLQRDVIHEDQICYLLAPFMACVSLWDPEEYVLDLDGPCF